VAVTLGSQVTGTTAVVTAPALETLTEAEAASGDYTPPTAGFYVLGLVTSANNAASSTVAVRAEIDVKF
jgi:hypothetical protein